MEEIVKELIIALSAREAYVHIEALCQRYGDSLPTPNHPAGNQKLSMVLFGRWDPEVGDRLTTVLYDAEILGQLRILPLGKKTLIRLVDYDEGPPSGGQSPIPAGTRKAYFRKFVDRVEGYFSGLELIEAGSGQEKDPVAAARTSTSTRPSKGRKGNNRPRPGGRPPDAWNSPAYEILNDGAPKATERAFSFWCEQQGISSPGEANREAFRKSMAREEDRRARTKRAKRT